VLFIMIPFQHLNCSPLGLVPKNVPRKFRLIRDLSYPKHFSVNAGIPQENSWVQYEGIGKVIDSQRGTVQILERRLTKWPSNPVFYWFFGQFKKTCSLFGSADLWFFTFCSLDKVVLSLWNPNLNPNLNPPFRNNKVCFAYNKKIKCPKYPCIFKHL
jgi:hypothetical protein